MTLFRQLFIGTSIAFLLLLMLVESIYIENIRLYMQEQLASHSQDVATSLGIVLPPSLAAKDVMLAEITVNAVFDRGFYQSIIVVNTRGEKLIEKQLSVTPPGVPEWFTRTFPMNAPSAESLITKGWQQLGRVVVTSHPNFAYKRLWLTTKLATAAMLLLYLLSLIVIRIFLSRVLHPLKEIESVANAISERNFLQVKVVPKIRELRSVVFAINKMSAKLTEIIAKEVVHATRFRNKSRKDALTAMDNRLGFEEHAHALLEHCTDMSSGVIYMLQIPGFDDYSIHKGQQDGDNLLKEIADGLHGVWSERSVIRSRIDEATFAVMAFNITREDASDLGDLLCAAMGLVVAAQKFEPALTFGCGGVYFSGKKVTLKELLAQSDLVFLKAMSHHVGTNLLEDMLVDGHAHDFTYLRELIHRAIADDRVALFSQRVVNLGSERQLPTEVHGRIINSEGEIVISEHFMPMSNRHQLTPVIDLSILKRLVEYMVALGGDEEFAVNLAIQDIHDKQFMEWLSVAMSSNPLVAKRIVLEFTEFGVEHDLKTMTDFVGEIRKFGVQFAIDHFGLHHEAFESLQRLKPSYVKLSPSYTRALREHTENQFFIASVARITHSLDIKLIALGVEDVGILTLLQELGVNGYQEYATGDLQELL